MGWGMISKLSKNIYFVAVYKSRRLKSRAGTTKLNNNNEQRIKRRHGFQNR